MTDTIGNHLEENVRQSILLVDDTPENLDVLKGILGSKYRIKAATSGGLALKIVANHQPDLILLDVMMPGMDGYEVCARLKADPATASIPVIFVTAMSDVMDEQKGFTVGGVDYILKPVQPGIVKARVASHLALADQRRACEEAVRQRTRQLGESQRAAIFMLGHAGHYNDTDTGLHIWRMASFAGALAQAVNWPVDRVAMLEDAAAMHDTGKIGIPDEILKAPRKLTADEWEIMKRHTTIGYEILSMSKEQLFEVAAVVALSHHEKWDGSGYPNGLAGEAIPEEARIVAIADVFDALTMNRPYKKAWSMEQAFEMVKTQAGLHFDPMLAETFMQIRPKIEELKASWDTRQSEEKTNFLY